MKHFVICCSIIFVISTQRASSQAILLRDVNGVPWKTEAYTEIQGSPYLENEWTDGYIVLKKSSNTIAGVKLKFDTYKNELIVLREETPIVVSNVREFGWLTTPKDTVKFKPVSGIKGFKDGYFLQVLYSGKNILYKNITTTISSVSAGYSDARKIQSFARTERLLIYNTDGIFEILSKKDLRNALKSYGSEIENLISKHDVSLKKEKTIISLLQEVDRK